MMKPVLKNKKTKLSLNQPATRSVKKNTQLQQSKQTAFGGASPRSTLDLIHQQFKVVAGIDSHSANFGEANTASTSLRGDPSFNNRLCGDKSTFSIRAAVDRGLNGAVFLDTSAHNSANVSGRGHLTPNANSVIGPGSVRSSSFLKENTQMYYPKSTLRGTSRGGGQARYMRGTKSSRSKLQGRWKVSKSLSGAFFLGYSQFWYDKVRLE